MKRSDKSLLFVVFPLLGLAALCAACVLAVIWFPLSGFTRGGARKAAVDFLRESPAVRAEIGEEVKVGPVPSGTVSVVNGRGKAVLVFTVEASRGRGRASLRLAKDPRGPWEVVSATLFVGNKKIPLLPGGALPSPEPSPGGPPSPPHRGEQGEGLAA